MADRASSRRSAALSRRELIASFLGAGVAATACRRAPGRAQVPGAIVDRAFEAGHLLRAAPPPLATGPARQVEVLVIGAGVAGLSAAWRLNAAGVRDVLVCEVDAEPGGTARSGRNAVSAFPWGAHYLPAPLTSRGPVHRLLTELGAVTSVEDDGTPRFREQLLVRDPPERLFYRGSWYPGLYLRAGASPADLAELDRFDDEMDAFAALVDGRGRKAFTVGVDRCSDDASLTALDTLSFAEWLIERGYRSERLRWMVDYACRDDFGATSARTSAWAGIWYFASRQDGRGRRSAGFLSWPEGNGHLVAQLSRSLPAASLLRSTLVHTVEPTATGARAHALDAVTRAPSSIEARQVVFAAPQYVAAHVLSTHRRDPPPHLAAFSYAPWVVANLTVSEAPRGRGFPLAWDNVLYESRSLGYVVATHQQERAADVGPTVLTWYLPLTGEDPKQERQRALAAGYADWETLVFADLSPAHPALSQQATRLEVWRWGHGMVRPTPGFLFGKARRAAQESVGAIHFAHSDLSGMALFEEANERGVAAAERALSGLGRRVNAWG